MMEQEKTIFSKDWMWWLKSVILATQEALFREITDLDQPRQKFHKMSISTSDIYLSSQLLREVQTRESQSRPAQA
jgi:hypothetical protein